MILTHKLRHFFIFIKLRKKKEISNKNTKNKVNDITKKADVVIYICFFMILSKYKLI